MNGKKQEAPRARSVWEELWADLQALRLVRLEREGLAALPEEQPVARLNSVLGDCASKICAIAGEADRRLAPALIELAWEEYLRNEWGRSLAPPFALSGFANVVMLSRCWAAAEETIAEQAQLRAGR